MKAKMCIFQEQGWEALIVQYFLIQVLEGLNTTRFG